MEDRQRSYTKRSSTGIWFSNVSFGNLAKLLCPSTPLDPFIVSHTEQPRSLCAYEIMCIKLFDHQLCMITHTATKPIINVYSSSIVLNISQQQCSIHFRSENWPERSTTKQKIKEKGKIFELSISEIAFKSF